MPFENTFFFKKKILFLTTVLLLIFFILNSLAVFSSAEEEPEYPVTYSIESKKLIDNYSIISNRITELDLNYWYRGIDAYQYSQAIVNAVYRVPFPGEGLCATWVGNVYQAAGLGYIEGNACDMWIVYCNSASSADIREGMIIAVRNSAASELGWTYGHCGILLRNPSYQGTDMLDEIAPVYDQIQYLKWILEAEQNKVCQKAFNQGMIRDEISRLEESLELLDEEDTDIYYYVDGRLIQADSSGHEKWLVADSSDTVGLSTLSSWLRQYDAYSTAAWGWGHKYRNAVVWAR